MIFLRRFFIILFSFFAIFILGFGYVNAEELTKYAKSAILIEPTTNTIIYENNSREQLAPASMTKIMTLLLIMEAYDNGVFKMDDLVPISENASSMGGSQVFLEAGSEMMVDELIKAICIASGNDHAVTKKKSWNIGEKITTYLQINLII